RAKLRGGKIPKLLKFDKIWGQRTEIDFVKKNVVGYMSKYFAKSNLRHETGLDPTEFLKNSNNYKQRNKYEEM
ncbi:MAG: hypothetical protein EBR55_11105, partial [Chitinophagia bacterium]|nr:hypothetical protein [Chitinophagia bacterium]